MAEKYQLCEACRAGNHNHVGFVVYCQNDFADTVLCSCTECNRPGAVITIKRAKEPPPPAELIVETRYQLWCYYETEDKWVMECFDRRLANCEDRLKELRQDPETPCMPTFEYVKVEVIK